VERMGESIGADQEVQEKLSVNGKVQGGELVVDWSYSGLHYEEGTIRGLAENYVTVLSDLIDHCAGQVLIREEYTPSDYGLGEVMTTGELDAFLGERMEDPLGQAEGSSRREWLVGLSGLSGLQEGMLFHSLYDGHAGSYVEQLSCEVGAIDKAAFGASWTGTMRRHSILRSSFYAGVFTVPVRAVYREVLMPVTERDLRGLDEAGQAEAIRLYEEEDRRQGFVLSDAPLMRIG
ncbi:condensation domain-containing protein, partial [Flavitalea flava]